MPTKQETIDTAVSALVHRVLHFHDAFIEHGIDHKLFRANMVGLFNELDRYFRITRAANHPEQP